MGKMQDNLVKIFEASETKVSFGNVRFPDFYTIWNSKYKDEVNKVYLELGGIKDEFPANLRKWDLELNGIALELDEFLHFNRYRKTTLLSSIYSELPNFPLKEYNSFCKNHENECLKAGSYGGKWTNNSCEKQFGLPSSNGDLTGNGAPRWKQRAFYDFIKDLSPILINVQIVRISIWDEIVLDNKKILIRDVLNECNFKAIEQIIDLIYSRKIEI